MLNGVGERPAVNPGSAVDTRTTFNLNAFRTNVLEDNPHAARPEAPARYETEESPQRPLAGARIVRRRGYRYDRRLSQARSSQRLTS